MSNLQSLNFLNSANHLKSQTTELLRNFKTKLLMDCEQNTKNGMKKTV